MIALFDIGGTKTRIALTSDFLTFGVPKKFDTPRLFGEAILTFKMHLAELCHGEKIAGAIVGIRGPLSPDRSSISSEVVLKDWVGKPLQQKLVELLDGSPVYLENDTALAGLGEAIAGGGRGHNIVAYHTVSTGVGGVRIVGGRVDASHSGFEPGHQIIDTDGTLEAGGAHTLEELVSGTALEKRTGKKPYETPQSDAIWDELAGYLAVGLKNTIMYWSPDVIVLGGSMIVGDPRILLSDVVRHSAILMGDFEPLPAIKDAELGDFGGLYGALALAKERFGTSGVQT